MTTLSKKPETATVHYSKPDVIRHPAIRKWLLRCLLLLEHKSGEQRSRRIMDRINETHFPDLFDPPDATADALLWSAILKLDELGVVKLERKSRRLDPHAPPWQSTLLVFQPAAENMVRQWLERPRVRPDQSAWQQALNEVVDQFADSSLIQTNPFPQLHKAPRDILNRLLLIPKRLATGKLTSYQLSAELFWGMSKLLRDKEDWLCQLLGLEADAFIPRSLLVEISFPTRETNGVLIIENLDSYVAAVDGLWPTGNDLILVYAQGFKLSAKSIRQHQRVRFHVHSQQAIPQPRMDEFCHYWFGDNNDTNWPCYAITDMDWSGMSIFRYLKQQFPLLEPWRPGYKMLIEEANSGNYHCAKDANKQGQNSVETSGSSWLDEHVLPLLNDDKLVDQEAIHLNDLLRK